MIVFDLICRDSGHQFEGWFASSSEFDDQKKRGLVTCPSCGSVSVEKAVMAPNVGVKANQALSSIDIQAPSSDVAVSPSAPTMQINSVQVPAEYKELVGKIAKVQEEILSKSEWVGEDFPEQARAIHYGETDEKTIHGIASAEDAEELEEEGINIAPLPLPFTPPETQN